MTKKQNRFVEEYLIDLNATQAAIRAGYSIECAREIGYENMTKPDIQKAIAKAMAERSKRTGVNQDRIVLELAKLALVNMADIVDKKAKLKIPLLQMIYPASRVLNISTLIQTQAPVWNAK